MQPVSPRSALQEMFVPSLSPHQQGTKTYSFKSRGRGQVKTWGGCSISWDTHSEAAGQRIEQENWEGDGDKQESKIHSLWSNIRTRWEVLAETDMSSITTSSKLSILVEGVLVLVSGFFFLVFKNSAMISSLYSRLLPIPLATPCLSNLST